MKITMLIIVAIMVLAFIYLAKIDMKVYKQYQEAKRRLLICSTMTFREYIFEYKKHYKHNHTILTFLLVSVIVILWYTIF